MWGNHMADATAAEEWNDVEWDVSREHIMLLIVNTFSNISSLVFRLAVFLTVSLVVSLAVLAILVNMANIDGPPKGDSGLTVCE